jgi:hypothetical protein
MLRTLSARSHAFLREPGRAAQNILKLPAISKRELRKNFNSREYIVA